jgi:predicted CXXCH cytochrome family protein
MVPSMTVPELFSLDWGGRMTYATCHDPHADDLGAEPKFMRTDARGKEFCDLCHQGALPLGGRVHAGAGSVAHAKSGIVELSDEFAQILDPVSLECLNCHDGVIAPDASYQLQGGDALTYQRDGRSHPIGVDYQQAAALDNELRPVSMLASDIVFYDGKVGCVSCHNPYSRIRRMLVIDDAGSELCLECHIK